MGVLSVALSKSGSLQVDEFSLIVFHVCGSFGSEDLRDTGCWMISKVGEVRRGIFRDVFGGIRSAKRVLIFVTCQGGFFGVAPGSAFFFGAQSKTTSTMFHRQINIHDPLEM